MANKAHYEMNAEPGSYEIKGSPVGLTTTRTAETWQFFAFVFAAVVTLALALLDEIPGRPWRIAAKGLAFFGLGYLVLLNVRVRGWLSTVLGTFKQERR